MLGLASHPLEVAAPSRLHFGLLSFGSHVADGSRQFGGAGVMIEKPGLLLRFAASESFAASGPAADRAGDFARRFAAYHRLAEVPRCRIEVAHLPRQHVGLGVGTSLGMAVAAGLAAWLGLPAMSAEQLALSVGRGRRSAVGTHGFVHGGLIVEGGKSAEDGVSPLTARAELPERWRFVLIIPSDEGLSGTEEEEAFRRLPVVAPETSAVLSEELTTRLLPAAKRGDFDQFSESLYRFNRAAGDCYASYQGGPYATRHLADLVAGIRDAGIRGVGQSSWGPTLFTLLPDQAAAERFASDFARRHHAEWIVTRPSRQGVAIQGPDGHQETRVVTKAEPAHMGQGDAGRPNG